MVTSNRVACWCACHVGLWEHVLRFSYDGDMVDRKEAPCPWVMWDHRIASHVPLSVPPSSTLCDNLKLSPMLDPNIALLTCWGVCVGDFSHWLLPTCCLILRTRAEPTSQLTQNQLHVLAHTIWQCLEPACSFIDSGNFVHFAKARSPGSVWCKVMVLAC